MKGLRVLELSEALNVDSADLLAVCAILKIKATSRLSVLSFEECKKITCLLYTSDAADEV